ncbi:Retrovirus-related Pol polyprotein from transposon TNT 1-94 [Dendrobium catenatum]|uniref:Retrovirus-related Pol polyprotein from transposon TNT 1-94 n=1 Tax=Dendrobium catenatum TaxID=906689 RepID=A0A2I0WJQ1_9ASPA|nr:Retrovirus-related Pol polyprotein from transposon TNT 1-94 [Dendrobium catenatum]
METYTETSSFTQPSTDIHATFLHTPAIPASLKFLMSYIKNVVAPPLNADNHPLWRSQVLKMFQANGYEGFLDGSITAPSRTMTSATGQISSNANYTTWRLLDQNLSAALYSVISPTILPYVLSVATCTEIWTVLDRRLQSSTRSRIIQLKHEFHYLSMKDKSMTQYLLEVKNKVDSLAAAGAPLAVEDVIHYTLDGLPPAYQAFKTSIRTNLQPLSLDDLYTLLCSEEINLAHETTRELHSLQISGNSAAFSATRGRGKGRGRSNQNHGRNSYSNPSQPNKSTSNRGVNTSKPPINCQICGKYGHSAIKCWHRHDDQYNADPPNTAFFSSPSPHTSSEWYLDSGASTHLTSDQTQFQSSQPYTGSSQVILGNGNQLPIHNTGKGILPTPQGSLQLKNLNLVPNLSFNLLSVYQLTRDNNCLITFSSCGFEIKDMMTHQVLLKGPCINGLYSIRATSPNLSKTELALISVQAIPDLWHRRLGHPSASTLSSLAKHFSDICISSASSMCNSCQMAKSHRKPFPVSQSTSVSPFDLVHSDVWGPSPSTSCQGYRYYVSFIDNFSKFTWVYPLIHKSEVFQKFCEFQKMIKCQFKTDIRILRTDGGGEFINNKFTALLKNLGIIHQFTCPYSPPQNGVAERKHRHLAETIRSLLLEASLPHTFWVDTLFTATYLINRLPSPNTSHKSPYEILYRRSPNYKFLKVFGCLCYPWLKPYTSSKLSPLSHPCVFIGYAQSQKGYRCLDPLTNKVYISPHVVFNEAVLPFSNLSVHSTSSNNPNNITPPLLLIPTSALPTSSSKSTTTPSHNVQSVMPSRSDTSPVAVQNSQPCTTISSSNDSSQLLDITRTHTSCIDQLPCHPMVTRLKSGHSKPKPIFDLSCTLQKVEPTTYNQALKNEHWRSAMSQEFQALQAQATWDLVPYSTDKNILGCKWIFRTKYKSDGSIARYKARLVAKGFNQEHGLDYTETFSPVAKMPTIRVLILIALHYKWEIHQLDVSNAFLHGKLSDTVYMYQPPGFVDSLHPNHVCKLNKALYGLKQSPREWYSTLSSHLQTIGFKISTADPSLLIYQKDSIRMYILVYVDDILLTGNSPTNIQSLLENLHNKFQMRNLGSLANFLGIQAVVISDGFLLHQQVYATSILEKAGMTNAKPVSTPASCKTVLTSTSNNEFSNPQLFRNLIGSLQYLTLTRPDIQYTVQQLSQHMHKPLNLHFEALKRLLRFIKGTTNFGISLLTGDLTLKGFSDADWATNSQDRKSISGYCNFLGKSLISWQVKKQTTVARSSTEAEYRVLATEASEVIWLRRLLEDFHIPQTIPTTIYCDNTSAIALANNPVYHARTKHIDVDCHFIRDCIQAKHLTVHHICTKDQIADIFTKNLPIQSFKFLSSKLIFAPLSSV